MGPGLKQPPVQNPTIFVFFHQGFRYCSRCVFFSHSITLIETILTSGQTWFGEEITQVELIKVNFPHLIWICLLLSFANFTVPHCRGRSCCSQPASPLLAQASSSWNHAAPSVVDCSPECPYKHTTRAPDKIYKLNFDRLYLCYFFTAPMFDHLLELSRWDDSNKWSSIGFAEEIGIIEIKRKLGVPRNTCVTCPSSFRKWE